MQSEMITEARDKLERFRSLQRQLTKDVKLVKDTIERIKTQVDVNRRSKLNPYGLLAHAREDYHVLLEFEHEKLIELFKKDEKYWGQNLEKVE